MFVVLLWPNLLLCQVECDQNLRQVCLGLARIIPEGMKRSSYIYLAQLYSTQNIYTFLSSNGWNFDTLGCQSQLILNGRINLKRKTIECETIECQLWLKWKTRATMPTKTYKMVLRECNLDSLVRTLKLAYWLSGSNVPTASPASNSSRKFVMIK